MKKQSLFLWFVAVVCAALIFTGCPQEADDDDTVLSDKAGLDTGSAVVKGVNVDFTGSTGDGAAIGTAATGTVAVVSGKLNDASAKTAFVAADSGTVKAVKVVAAAAGSYTEAAFNAAAAYADADVIAVGDVFVVKVTSQDGKAAKWYKITVLEDVSGNYSLKTTDAASALPDVDSGLTILSAVKDAAGKVTIKLGGTVASTYVYTANGSASYPAADPAANFNARDFWIGASKVNDPEPAAGKYTAAYIHGLFPAAVGTDKIIAIKQTNQALRFFTGGVVTTTALSSPVISDESPALFLPASTATPPVRWRVYNTGAIKTGDIFGLLVWDGNNTVTPQTATFEIQEWAEYANDKQAAPSGYSATVVVDYSAVDFGDGTLPALTLSVPTWSASTDNAANVNEMLVRLWNGSPASVVQGITQGNVFKYAPGTKTLTVNKANVTDGLKTWITTQWGGTSVPVKVTLQSGTPSAAADTNWSGAHLIWIDVATVVANESATISLTGGGTATYKIAVTP